MVRMPVRAAAALRAAPPVLLTTVLAATMLVTVAMLAACGSATTSGSSPAAGKPSSASPSAPSVSAAPSAGPTGPRLTPPPVPGPMITAVHLSTTFTPDTLTVAAGQKFEVIVSTSVEPTGDGFPQNCAPGTADPVGNGMLSVSCPAPGSYLFTAEQTGSLTLTATVRPHCTPGQICPQWITDAALSITIT